MTDVASFPFVAIVGGFYSLTSQEASVARNAAEKLGQELAKAAFGLVVYLSDPGSLEPHVVRGFASTPDALPRSIRVQYAQSQGGQVIFPEEKTRPELFCKATIFPGSDWEAPFYRSLAQEDDVDAVLLVSGGNSTLIAAQIAVARELPILALDAFGGSALKIWTQLSQRSSSATLPTWRAGHEAELVEWLKEKCEAAQRARETSSRRARLHAALASKLISTIACGATFVATLAALLYGLVGSPEPSLFPAVTMIGLACAGAAGALVRSVIWGEEGNTASTLVVGSIAGFAVGLAYIIPQWIGAPGVLEPSQDVVVATDKIQLASALLVAISAGVGFDTVFRRLKQRAEDVRVGIDV